MLVKKCRISFHTRAWEESVTGMFITESGWPPCPPAPTHPSRPRTKEPNRTAAGKVLVEHGQL